MLPRIVFAVALGFAACDRDKPSGVAKPIATSKVTTYEVRGTLREVSADRQKAVIAHEAIPGYMEAMAMEFDIRDSVWPSGLDPGDRVAFRLSVTETRSWIDHVRRLGKTTDLKTHEATIAEPTATSSLIGTLLPDCRLIDQRGKAFHLSDFKGQALAITFIFTRCPLPNFCPLMNQHFAVAQHELKNGAASSKWHLLSISLDPEYDTPERLATYAASYEPDPHWWTFVTGDAEEIGKFGTALGLVTSRNGAQIEHNLRTVVTDPSGRVRQVFTGNGWQPSELIEEMRRAMNRPP
jgi:protein SCO1